ncbi:MAG TPA: chemotaxis response regulator protein-glutamate methylesterase [Candidatus Methylacidiphilales bacterium]
MLIVDDSVVMRRLISDMVLSDSALEVAGIAHHGHIALAKIPQVSPDIVTLDVDMPEMNGLETLARIHADYPDLPVIMLSGLTEDGAKLTIEALAMGAADYVTKPSGIGINSASVAQVREELLRKIKALGEGKLHRAFRSRSKNGGEISTDKSRLEVVIIGVSTGGPNALVRLLPDLPADFPVPVLVVQHMPPLFTRFLAERLAKICSLRVREAVPGARLEPGTIWIAPGDFHMEIERAEPGVTIRLHQGPLENSCRPAVDPTFRSAVECFGSRVLGIVMTGMGQDGLQGSRCIRDAGGQILAQDRKSSVIWGMPRFVVEEGLPDEVLPLDQLAAGIRRRVAVGRSAPREILSEATHD